MRRGKAPFGLLVLSSCASTAPHAHPPVSAVTIAPPPAGSGPSRNEPPAKIQRAQFGEQWAAKFRALDPATREPFCRQAVDYRDALFEECSVDVVGNGAAAVLTIRTECGGDSCSVRSWLVAADDRIFEIPHAGGNVEAAPDASFVLVDVERSGPYTNPAESDIVTVRVDFPLRTETEVASCFAPKLSPGGRWFVCRDRSANVLRFPVARGPVEMVAVAGVPPEDIEWVPYAYVYPEPVRFPSPDQLEYRIQLADEAISRTIPWRE